MDVLTCHPFVYNNVVYELRIFDPPLVSWYLVAWNSLGYWETIPELPPTVDEASPTVIKMCLLWMGSKIDMALADFIAKLEITDD